MIKNIFLAQVILSSDLKEFKTQRCFIKINDQLKNLYCEGITLEIEGKSIRVYFALLGILGDNLGVNSFLGFQESFIAHYYCRFCVITKNDAAKLSLEMVHLLRDIENYEIDVKEKARGVKYNCAFNDIPCFHNVKNWTCDPMHDFFLGVCRYDLAKILNDFIVEKEYFTFDVINSRLKYFDFSDIDRGSAILSLQKNHIRDGYLIITAAQMSALVSYLGIIIGDLIPDDDPS